MQNKMLTEAFTKYYDALVKYARTKMDTNCEDVVQQTFLECCQYEREIKQIRAFLYKVLKRKIAKLQSGRHVQQLRELESPDFVPRTDSRLDVETLIERLPLPEKAAITKVYLEEWTQKRCSEQTGVPTSCVQATVQRGLEMLRQM